MLCLEDIKKTPLFVFITEILWRTFWFNNWQFVFGVAEILRCSRWSGRNHQWDFKLYIWVKQTNKQTKLRTNIKNIVVVCSCVFLFFFFFCTKYSWSKVRIFVKYVGLFWVWFLVFWSNSEEIISDGDLESISHFPIN